jgi:hypothetical protein
MNKDLAQVLEENKVDLERVSDVIKYCEDTLRIVDGWESNLELKAEGVDDTATIKLAGDTRKKVKKDRTSSVAFFKSKREEVQKEMEVYTMKDKALLKIQQYVENKAKAVEAHLEAIEKLPEIAEKERLDKIEQERLAVLETLVEDTSFYNVREMPDETFNAVVAGIKAQKALEEKERLEREALEAKEKALDELFEQRQKEIGGYLMIPGCEPLISSVSRDTSAEDFEKIKKSIIDTHDKYQAEQLKVRQEAEKARLAQIEADKQLKAQQALIEKQQQEAKAAQEKADKEKAEAEKKAQAEEQQRKLGQQRQEILLELGFVYSGGRFTFDKFDLVVTFAKEDLLSLTPDNFDSKLLVVKQKIEESKKAPLLDWVEAFEIPRFEDSGNKEIEAKRQEVISKFNGFKKWAKTL